MNNMNDNMRKVRIGVLKTYRKHHLSEFENTIKKTFPHLFDEFKYANLDQSYQLWSLGERIYPINDYIYCSGRFSKKDFELLLDRLSFENHFIDCDIWLYFSSYRWVGGLKSTLCMLLKNAIKLVDLDKDSICAYGIHNNNQEGIMIDYDDTYYDSGYELFIWGNWLNNFNKVLNT